MKQYMVGYTDKLESKITPSGEALALHKDVDCSKVEIIYFPISKIIIGDTNSVGNTLIKIPTWLMKKNGLDSSDMFDVIWADGSDGEEFIQYI